MQFPPGDENPRVCIVFPSCVFCQENFYFETSPQVQKCEEERVSLEQPPRVRSPTCCKVTERGGKLPFIEDWKKNGWARTDNFVTDPNNITYQTQLPPTTLVLP